MRARTESNQETRRATCRGRQRAPSERAPSERAAGAPGVPVLADFAARRCPFFGRLMASLRFFCLAATLVLAPVALPTAAWAQGSSADRADAARLNAIRAQMDRGQGLFLAGQYETAAQVFEEGYAAHPYSAFLFNAGVCYQKMGDAEAALASFRRYLEKDPNAPDAPSVQERVTALQAAVDAALARPEGEEGEDESPAAVEMPDDDTGMKSLVIVETDPSGAPVKIFRRKDQRTPDYREGAKNSGWSLVAARSSPVDLTLDVGRYHVVVEAFAEYNRSETDIDVSPGHVHHFRANLSQGEFLGFVEFTANVEGAAIYLDGGEKDGAVWGKTPHGAMVEPGPHVAVLEAPGYEPQTVEFEVEMGGKKPISVVLERVGFGVLRVDADVSEASIRIDERDVGVWRAGQSALEFQVSAGPHQVTVMSRGYKVLRKQVVVPEGQLVPMRAKMIRRVPRGAAWTQAIVSAGFIGASIYFGVESNRLKNELDADRARGILNASDPRINQGFWYSVGANGGFAVGGVLGLLSVYNFIKDPYPEPQLYRGKPQEFDRIRRNDPTLSTTDEESTREEQSKTDEQVSSLRPKDLFRWEPCPVQVAGQPTKEVVW